jgi:hypothetical protein
LITSIFIQFGSPRFDVENVTTLIKEGHWIKLIQYLEKFLSTLLQSPAQHPGLMMYLHTEEILRLLQQKKIDEAKTYFDTYLRSIANSKGQYVPNNLKSQSDKIEGIIKEM